MTRTPLKTPPTIKRKLEITQKHYIKLAILERASSYQAEKEMDPQHKKIQILRELGLTFNQAKVFLFLSCLGRQKAMVISKGINSDRSNVYQALGQLQKKGLVAKVLGRPILYEPIPFEEAISLLLGFKEEEFEAVKKDAKELVNSRNFQYSSKPLNYYINVEERQKKSNEQDVITSINSVERSYDMIMSHRIFVDYFLNLSEYQLDCVKRGIEYRVITELENIQQNTKKVSPFLKYSNFHLRYVTEPLKAEFGVTDKKSAGVVLMPLVALGDTSVLLTNHPSCIHILQCYFDKMWNEAQEYKLEDLAITE